MSTALGILVFRTRYLHMDVMFPPEVRQYGGMRGADTWREARPAVHVRLLVRVSSGWMRDAGRGSLIVR